MSMNKKIILILVTAGVLLLGLFAIPTIRQEWINASIAIVAVFCLTILALQFFLTQRLTLLRQQLSNIIHSWDLQQRTRISGHDDIAAVAKDTNILIEKLQSTHQSLEKNINERTSDLQKTIIQLEQQLAEHKVAEQQVLYNRETLTQLARYDALTSLPNRIFFNEILNKSINHAKRRNRCLAVLALSLDTFNDINLNRGHDVSDYILKEIANRLTKALRAEDVLAKLDGDEFNILLTDMTKPKFAGTVAEKLLNACSQPIMMNANEFTLTASIGIAIYPNDGESLETLLKNASTALMNARNIQNSTDNKDAASKGHYQFYARAMDIEAHEHIQLEAALRKAIQNNELTLYYQPRLNIKKGNITAVEALLRWNHPEFGVINPAKFIPIAEETGLMRQIGEWSIREACKKNKYWQEEGYEHITIALKLSPQQFTHRGLPDMINAILEETGLNAKYLELEIHESTIMSDIEQASQQLERIRATGIQTSIDHFGIGYTSISHLKHFAVNSIKIDKSFIQGIPEKPDDVAICAAITALAHNLGLEVVAEGVESAEQVQTLANHQCDLIQGYFISHPLPAQKVVLQFKKLQERVFT